ncbi:MAG: Gfo/Idh/MocA family protein [Planctomycetota bacterium]|jgi:predicted dehydrogenase
MGAKVRVGLIGCGRRLNGVLNNTMKNSAGNLEVAAVFDPNQESIDHLKENVNIGEGMKVYDDYHALVKDDTLDWIMIGSWNCFHAEQVIAAFEAGKNVFCEKPLATNVEHCLAMRDAWKKSGKEFIIGFVLRYSSHYIQIKNILDSGKIGDIVSMEFNETLNFNHGGYIHADWRRKTEFAGSHILEKCCHDIDLVNWLVGSRARRVASFGNCDFFKPENRDLIEKYGSNNQGAKAFQTWPRALYDKEDRDPFNTDKDIYDNQVAIIEFENNVRSTFHTNCSTALNERRMYFCGTEGTLRADVITGEIEVKELGFYQGIEDLSTDGKGGHGGGDQHLGKYLAARIAGVGDVENIYFDSTLDDGLTSAFTAFGFDEAAETGQVVDMAKYWEKI